MTNLTRRRFLAISAAAGIAGPATAAPAARWRGIALGAHAEMQLVGVSQTRADRIFNAVAAEISRLEDIFSLYRDTSAISRLNRDCVLDAPPPDLLRLCSLTTVLHNATGGAFDPTVQPLWTLAAQSAAREGRPAQPDITRARAAVGWPAVRYDPARIAFGRPGMAVTFNGIAQGFITDRIAEKLLGFGLTDVLIDIGEIRAWGLSPSGAAWQAGIADPAGGCCAQRVTLADRALATSAPFGTVLDAAGTIGHILDPATGDVPANTRQVSVSAPRADVADGLSTAFCLMDRPGIASALAAFPGARVEHLSRQARNPAKG